MITMMQTYRWKIKRESEVRGVIDFGDSLSSWKVNENAIACAYTMTNSYGNTGHSLASAATMLRGFSSVYILNSFELKHLRLLIASRLIQVWSSPMWNKLVERGRWVQEYGYSKETYTTSPPVDMLTKYHYWPHERVGTDRWCYIVLSGDVRWRTNFQIAPFYTLTLSHLFFKCMLLSYRRGQIYPSGNRRYRARTQIKTTNYGFELCPDTSKIRKRWNRLMSLLRTQEKIKKDGFYFIFFELYAFIILTSTLVLGINYFVIITRPLHPIPVRKRSSSSCYMIETYNRHHRFPCYWTMSSHILNGIFWYFQRMLPELQLLLFFL